MDTIKFIQLFYLVFSFYIIKLCGVITFLSAHPWLKPLTIYLPFMVKQKIWSQVHGWVSITACYHFDCTHELFHCINKAQDNIHSHIHVVEVIATSYNDHSYTHGFLLTKYSPTESCFTRTIKQLTCSQVVWGRRFFQRDVCRLFIILFILYIVYYWVLML